jgi:serine protease Do
MRQTIASPPVIAIAIAVAYTCCSHIAIAQSNTASPLSVLAVKNPAVASERDAEYAALARDVNALDRELGIVKRVVKLVTPAVVHIEAKSTPHKGARQIEEAGSGVIVEFNGRQYILTNRHVIGSSTPDRIDIHLADGRVFRPSKVLSDNGGAEDNGTDVAVMAVDAAGLPAARLGNSDALEIGDYVLAIGSPFGLSQSVTRGIVSAKGRHNLNLGHRKRLLQDFIQTDAAINPGNSGGPLVNLRGEVVGLNTAIASASGGNEGVGFTVPINIAARVASALVEGKDPPRGYLGVKLAREFTLERAQAAGLTQPTGSLIVQVNTQSPAERAQIRVNDVVIQYNGIRVEHDTHLINLVNLTNAGQEIDVVVLRDGKPVTLKVQIGDARNNVATVEQRPAPRVEATISRRAGN